MGAPLTAAAASEPGQVRAGPSAFGERGAACVFRVQTGVPPAFPLSPGRRPGAALRKPLENSTVFIGGTRVQMLICPRGWTGSFSDGWCPVKQHPVSWGPCCDTGALAPEAEKAPPLWRGPGAWPGPLDLRGWRWWAGVLGPEPGESPGPTPTAGILQVLTHPREAPGCPKVNPPLTPSSSRCRERVCLPRLRFPRVPRGVSALLPSAGDGTVCSVKFKVVLAAQTCECAADACVHLRQVYCCISCGCPLAICQESWRLCPEPAQPPTRDRGAQPRQPPARSYPPAKISLGFLSYLVQACRGI
ncbi:uncharacterized protein LOC115275983 [Suricata suricatta]|uniref:uncharacterized protein LOC115275983 n=1 Tax=Suricata suricatta TaxID=37032 RepID=UPI0011553015|nr:uncharacterized protein LOC115275983 [Suricata suricatta]